MEEAPQQRGVELADEEAALFRLLLEVVAESGAGTTLRVAGGWVRDKLLGIRDGAGDIDVVVDNVSAVAFAELLARYRPSETRGGKVIASRPEQHKHVEVVALKLLDAPAIELSSHVGRTPEEEARRRDFTINSLFYNINLAVVEDLTGTGLRDLRAGVIKTPVAPRETLGQDPLRILRCIRFATRFHFRIDPDLAAAMMDETLQKELKEGIARQRLAIEVTKMLSGHRPSEALLAMCHYNLHRIVFTPSKSPEFWTDELTRLACLSVQSIMTNFAGGGRDGPALEAGVSPVVYYLAVLFLPLCFSPLCLEDRGRETFLPFTKWDMREHWMFPDHSATAIFLLLSRAHDLEALAQNNTTGEVADRLQAARVLRELGPSWVHGLQLAQVLSCLRIERRRSHASEPSGPQTALQASMEGTEPLPAGHDAASGGHVEDMAPVYNRFRKWIAEGSGLVSGPQDSVWEVAPLVSAKDLLVRLRQDHPHIPLPKGKDVGRLLSLALDWQLERHNVGGPAETPARLASECVGWLVHEWARANEMLL